MPFSTKFYSLFPFWETLCNSPYTASSCTLQWPLARVTLTPHPIPLPLLPCSAELRSASPNSLCKSLMHIVNITLCWWMWTDFVSIPLVHESLVTVQKMVAECCFPFCSLPTGRQHVPGRLPGMAALCVSCREQETPLCPWKEKCLGQLRAQRGRERGSVSHTASGTTGTRVLHQYSEFWSLCNSRGAVLAAGDFCSFSQGWEKHYKNRTSSIGELCSRVTRCGREAGHGQQLTLPDLSCWFCVLAVAQPPALQALSPATTAVLGCQAGISKGHLLEQAASPKPSLNFCEKCYISS